MTYNYHQTCPGCFRADLSDGRCVKCGYDVNSRKNLLALAEHTILAGKYVVGKVLGIGGFGITYLALDLSLNKLSAIKEYLPRDIAGREAGSKTIKAHTEKEEELYKYGLERFIQEAQTLARFDHYNIVRVREVFQENNTCYIVMDYYEGMTLEEYIKERGGRLTEQETIDIMMPILDGLRVVHSEGILHRDIKPQNIYITKGGRGILIDFGSARMAMGQRSRSVSIALTPGYAPYEQYQSKGQQAEWTDIYGVGATMYHMLTGEAPPDAVERKDRDELIPPIRRNPSISEKTNRAVMKALAVYHKGRQKSVKELQDMLIGEVSIGGHKKPTKVSQQIDDEKQIASQYPTITKSDKSDTLFSKRIYWVLGGVVLTLLLLLYITNYMPGKKINEAKVLVESGDSFRDMGQWDKAIDDYTKAIQLDPNNARAYNNRGISYAKKGLHERAIEDYTKAIQLDPNNAYAYTGRGFSYAKKGFYDRAIEDYTKAIQLDPNNAYAYTGRGFSYAEKGFYDRAIEDYTKAIQLDPNNALAYFNRGVSYAEKGFYDRAIEDYTKAIQLNPNYAEAYFNRGVSYAKKGFYDRAIEDYTKAIQLDPNDVHAYFNRGINYAKKGFYDRAIEDFTKAIQLDPNNAKAYHARGLSYGIKGLDDRAIEDFDKACSMGVEKACEFLNKIHSLQRR